MWSAAKRAGALKRGERADRYVGERGIKYGIAKRLGDDCIEVGIVSLDSQSVPKFGGDLRFKSLRFCGCRVHVSSECGRCCRGRRIGIDADRHQRGLIQKSDEIVKTIVEISEFETGAAVPEALVDSEIECTAPFRADRRDVILGSLGGSE